VSNDTGSTDGGKIPGGEEAPHDALGDTQLGRSLKELIKEIGREKEALKRALDPALADEAEKQAAEEDFDPSISRFDQALELAATGPREPKTNGSDTGDLSEDPSESQVDAAPPSTPAPAPEPAAAAADSAESPVEGAISEAMRGMEEVLRRFAEAERRRAEEELAEYKIQLKKATMIVIKKQVDAARARWTESQTFNEAKVAEHYQRLKALADKVAKQKAQIQKAKHELEKKLEVADRLHTEFDEIRTVLDGQIGAIDALDENGDPTEPES
jgi:chromosome segregation ATPase